MGHEKCVVFLAFANNHTIQDKYLANLRRESLNIEEKLWPYKEDNSIEIYREDNISIKRIFSLLTERFSNTICLFHYGGHADGGRLELESIYGQTEHAAGIGLATLLGQQKNLKLVFLNGCSTKDHVNLLLSNGVKAVIATETSIKDLAATEFAEQFYSSLANDKTILESYIDAKAFIQTKYENDISIADKEIIYKRGFSPEEDEGDFPWGLYVNEASKEILNWKLPKKDFNLLNILHTKANPNKLKANNHILFPVFNQLQHYNESLEISYEDEEEIEEVMQDHIIKSYPLPIGEQIRKLFSTTEAMQFFTLDRLQQLIRTYEITIKLLAYIMLPDLWDQINKNHENLFDSAEIEEINNFCIVNKESYQSFDYISLIRTICKIFEKNSWTPFLSELGKFVDELDGETELNEAYLFLRKVRLNIAQENILVQHIEDYCSKGEYFLSILLQKVAFLSKYRLVTIRNINLLKERMENPVYAINMGILRGIDPQRMKTRNKEFQAYTDSYAVILMKKVQEIKHYLNLSPFIIDENAYTGYLNFKIFFYAFSEKNSFNYEFTNTGEICLEITPFEGQKESYSPLIHKRLTRFYSHMP